MDILLPVLIVGVIGLIAGVGLSLASKFMYVPVDEKQEKIREALPGANCGACGYSGCDGYATALAEGKVAPDKCTAGGEDTAKALSDVLGVKIESIPKVAYIACNGNGEITKQKYCYEGMQSCTAVSFLHGGPIECEFGCIGFGDCVKVCPFGAISLNNGRPNVCTDLCVGCGKCAAACPKSLISLIPKDAKVRVTCANKNKGAAVVKTCGASCIACVKCEKSCEHGAIKVIDNVAVIDYGICTGCGKCKEVCPRGVIV